MTPGSIAAIFSGRAPALKSKPEHAGLSEFFSVFFCVLLWPAYATPRTRNEVSAPTMMRKQTVMIDIDMNVA